MMDVVYIRAHPSLYCYGLFRKPNAMLFKMRSLICLLAGLASIASDLEPAGWRKQSVYQIVTDRFARTDGSTFAPCDPYEDGGIYCNGTWAGLINHLDYIQKLALLL